ncbi:cysteine desulfurase NifS [Metallumcola ferriviriculae]|uniref:Cysteine desulfurase IscS n=1 Tax=Metallumcola ferriviriculae TaxID=3039180 RepID=A0AAU0UV68_9FIRM|nr:cysteine desulfurase NifS [Desulfitibacteraceae bacterium MK1]
MRKVYLDHSATTPVHPEVVDVINKYLTDVWGNPSSIHSFGREAKKGLEEAREKVASLMGADPKEIIFTSGGTEADNMAIIGSAHANEKKGKHIITSQVEHHAVLDAFKHLEKNGFEVTYLPVDEEGLVSVAEVERAIREDTTFISIMHVNNEIGTIQPVEEIGAITREKGIIFHVDAVQSYGKIPVDVKQMNVDLLTASSHKIYGPKGAGCLYIRKGVKVPSFTLGGGQEKKRRPGTENMPGIVGFGKAAEIAARDYEGEMKRLSGLRDKLVTGIEERIPDIRINGHRTKRLPGNANISFRFIEGESLLLSLDMKGIAASSGSACTSGSLDPSHVLLAIGLSHEIAHGSLRMTLGGSNTQEDIDYVLEVLPEIVERLRSMSPLYQRKEACKQKECYEHVQ